MKNRKYYINKAKGEPVEMYTGSTSDEMMADVIGTKVLYNWLYQQEEKDYYLSEKVPDSLPDFSQEALFVEYLV